MHAAGRDGAIPVSSCARPVAGHDAAAAAGDQAAAVLQHGSRRLRRGGARAEPAARARRARPAGPGRRPRRRTSCPPAPRARRTPQPPAHAGRAARARPPAPLDADCEQRLRRRRCGWRAAPGIMAAAGRAISATTSRGIEDMADARPHAARASRRAARGSTFHDPVDRLIAAHLIALLDAGRAPAGRALRRSPQAMGMRRSARSRRCARGCSTSIRPACSPATCANAWRSSSPSATGSIPAMQALLDNLELLARRDMRRADGGLRRRCRGPGGHGRRDPRARSEARRQLRPAPAPTRGARYPDAAGPGRRLADRAQPRDAAARAGQPALLRPRRRRRRSKEERLPRRALQSANWLVKSLQQRARPS